MSLAGVVEERNRCSENLCWGIWCSQGVREGFLGKGKREKVWVWINWGRERGRRILGRGRNMQCVIPSPVVRGSQASAVEVRARRWGRISNANFKFVFVPVPTGNSWKLSVFFLFVCFYCLSDVIFAVARVTSYLCFENIALGAVWRVDWVWGCSPSNCRAPVRRRLQCSRDRGE